MTRWSALSFGGKIAVILLGLALFIGFFPLRVAIDLAGVGGNLITARQVRGGLWGGRIDDLMIGSVALGTVTAAVAPGPLMLGRVRLNLERVSGGDVAGNAVADTGTGGPLRGAWISGFNRRGISDVTGSMPAGGAFAPLPITQLEWDDATIEFAGDTCAKAEGRLRVKLGAQYAGLNLSQGLSGPISCDGTAVLFPLVSQTGMEQLTLRLRQDGRFSAKILVKGAKGSNVEALAAAGLSAQGGDYGLSLEGAL